MTVEAVAATCRHPSLTHAPLPIHQDYQVSNLPSLRYSKMLYVFLHGFVVMMLASIPSIILNAPVGLAASYWANQQAAKDLKASRVKIAARDVLLSKKIAFSLVAVPALWISYALLLLVLTPLSAGTVLVMFLCCPFFSYLGVMAVEAGMVDIKDLRPAFLRLLPSFRQEMERLPAIRLQLQRDVRAATKKYGPQVGNVYYGKASEWERTTQRAGSGSGSFPRHADGDGGGDGGDGRAHVSSGMMARARSADKGPVEEVEGARIKSNYSETFTLAEEMLDDGAPVPTAKKTQ